MKAEDMRMELLGVDIDLRLRWLWEQMDKYAKEGKLGDLSLVALLVRGAYGQGYIDGQSEPHGKLQEDNGFPPPVDAT